MPVNQNSQWRPPPRPRMNQPVMQQELQPMPQQMGTVVPQQMCPQQASPRPPPQPARGESEEILYNVEHIFNENGKVVRKMPIDIEGKTIWVEAISEVRNIPSFLPLCLILHHAHNLNAFCRKTKSSMIAHLAFPSTWTIRSNNSYNSISNNNNNNSNSSNSNNRSH